MNGTILDLDFGADCVVAADSGRHADWSAKKCTHHPLSVWHSQSGYVGFSWTYLLFGWFVPVIRGELGIGILHLVITFVSFGLSQLIFPFLYNRQYMNRMLTSGWALDSNDPNYDIAREKLNIVS